MQIRLMLRHAIVSLSLACSGCATDLPVVTADGSLVGGNDRIRSILDIGCQETINRQQQTFSVVFIGEPYSNAIVRGSRDHGNDGQAIGYQLVVPAEGVDRSHQAVIMIPSGDIAKPATTLLYRRERAAWNPLSAVTLSKSP